jgi:hypothetical protein
MSRSFAPKWVRAFLFHITFLVFASHAQTDLSTIRGVAADQSGAVVPNVAISLTDTERNTTRQTTTNANGEYEIPFLIPGVYRLEGTGSGFRVFVANEIRLANRETRRIDVMLEVGPTGSEVTVTAGAAVIATEGSQVAAGFSGQKFVDGPLSQSFFPQAQMTTLPNVQTEMGGFNLRLAGQPSQQVAESLDGVVNDGTVNLVQNMFDFEELQVVPVNNTAEFSRVGNFTLTGRGGTNQFHGRVFYDFTNSALNARNTFEPYKVPYKEHRGAANLSGPIIRNKTFFYVSYNMTRIPSSTFYNRNVPPAAFRQGNFSSLLGQANPVSIKDPTTGQPFPGNIIPPNRINATSNKIQDLYIPLPNQGTAGTRTNNFGFLHQWPIDLLKWDGYTGRVDHNFSSRNQLFARYIDRHTPYVLAGSFPNVGTWTRDRDHYSIVVSDTHTFTPALINTARFGWISDRIIDGGTIDGFTPITGDAVVNTIGLQGVNPRNLSAMGFPRLNIEGVTNLNVQAGGTNQDRRDLSYSDTVSWSKGPHVIKFGGELRTFNQLVDVVPEGTYGIFGFNGTFTGDAYADFLLGLPQNSARLDPLTNRRQKAYELGLFITDTFKISRRLTLDYGLRWDYFGSSKYEDNLQFNWDAATNQILVPQESLSKISPLYPTNLVSVVAGQAVPTPSKTNFRPRFGGAYRISDTFVIRGGYGIFTETLGNFNRLQGTGPFQLSETFFNSVVNGQPLFSLPNPFPAGSGTIPSQSVSGYPLQTENGAIHQFNASIEKQLGGFGLRLSYIGSRSNGLNYLLELNKPQPSTTPFAQSRRPYPQFINATQWQSDGRARYDSGQIEINRKWGALQLNAHYTISNAMADYLNLQNPYDHYQWNRDQYNSRHRAVIDFTYDLPFGKGRRFLGTAPGAVNAVLGGWQLTTISYFQTGQYFTPTFTGSDPSNTNTFGGIPDRIGEGNLPRSERNPQRWFDASAFRVPAPGTFGNSGVNVLQGPGLNLHHLTIIKEFRPVERVRFVLQGNAANVFNRPHYAFPSANISIPGQVGRFLTTLGSGSSRERANQREISVRLRIEF